MVELWSGNEVRCRSETRTCSPGRVGVNCCWVKEAFHFWSTECTSAGAYAGCADQSEREMDFGFAAGDFWLREEMDETLFTSLSDSSPEVDPWGFLRV